MSRRRASGRVSYFIMLPARHSYARMRTPFGVILISKNIMHPFARRHLEKLVAKSEPGQRPVSISR